MNARWYLGAACVVQLVIAAVVAITSTHNGFVWYSGGDSTEYWTSSWSLAHGEIGQAFIGYGVPVLYAWVPLVTGATLVSGLPVIAIFQLLVLVPLAAVLVWAIADLLFGRTFAWWALAVWIVGPLLLLWGFRPDYAPEFRDLFLAPHWYGLTDMADMPSLVAALAATWATLRTFERRALDDAVLAGLFVGILVAFKPANGFYAPAVAVLLLATRDARAIGAFVAGCAPSLAALAVWKDKGLGSLPILAYSRSREALGSHPVIAVTNRYVHFDWAHLQSDFRDFNDVFWSVRLLEFLVLAGLVGAARRSPVKAVFLGVWFAAFCIVKGSSSLTSIASVSYFRYVEPGLPAYALLACSVVFLVPRKGRPWPLPHRPGPLPGGRRTVIAAVSIFALLPLALLAIMPAATSAHYAWDPARGNDAPISNALAAHVARTDGQVRISWRPVHPSGATSYYAVYRSTSAQTCAYPTAGGQECDLLMTTIGYTRSTSFVDPDPGRHWYRIGLMANYRNVMDGSDLMLIGPVTAAPSSR